MSGKLENANEILGFIELCSSQIQKELNTYPKIKDKVNLADTVASLRNEFISQAQKSRDASARLPMTIKQHFLVRAAKHEGTGGRPVDTFTGSPAQWSETKRDWMSFKAEYMKWAKNLIANLNRAKMVHKLSWLNVEMIAQGLVTISMSENNVTECFTLTEIEEVIDHEILSR